MIKITFVWLPFSDQFTGITVNWRELLNGPTCPYVTCPPNKRNLGVEICK